MRVVAFLLVFEALIASAALLPPDDLGLTAGLYDDADTDGAVAPSFDPLLPAVVAAPRARDAARLAAPPASRAPTPAAPISGRAPRAPPAG